MFYAGRIWGGIRNIEEVRRIFELGMEKVVVNSYAVKNPLFITECAELFGSQSIVVSIDVKRSLFGKYEVYTHRGKKRVKLDPVGHAIQMEKLGAGELLLNSIDKDGAMNGYDIDLIKAVSESVNIPVIACGGSGTMKDFLPTIRTGGASAVAAGSLFVFQGKHRGVLLSYPTYKELSDLFEQELTGVAGDQ